ncbi:hypothetical protein AU385_06640 [Bacillus halotolerans]|nr:hypothetical protein AU385_06640 [Bacillus halotolerans]
MQRNRQDGAAHIKPHRIFSFSIHIKLHHHRHKFFQRSLYQKAFFSCASRFYPSAGFVSFSGETEKAFFAYSNVSITDSVPVRYFVYGTHNRRNKRFYKKDT